MRALFLDVFYPEDTSAWTRNPLTFQPDQLFLGGVQDVRTVLNATLTGYFTLSNASIDVLDTAATSQSGKGAGWGPLPWPHAVVDRAVRLSDGRYDVRQEQVTFQSLDAVQFWMNSTLAWSAGCEQRAWRASAHSHSCAAQGWMHSLVNAQVHLPIRSFNAQRILATGAACLEWDVVLNIATDTPAQFQITLLTSATGCEATNAWTMSTLTVCLVLACSISLLHQALLCCAAVRWWGVVRDLIVMNQVMNELPKVRRSTRAQRNSLPEPAHMGTAGSPAKQASDAAQRKRWAMLERVRARDLAGRELHLSDRAGLDLGAGASSPHPSSRARASDEKLVGTPLTRWAGCRSELYNVARATYLLGCQRTVPGIEGSAPEAVATSYTVVATLPQRIAQQHATQERMSGGHTHSFLSAADLRELWSSWTVVMFFANLAAGLYTAWALAVGPNSVPIADNGLIGLAAAMQWVCLSQYMRWSKHLNIVLTTLRRGLGTTGFFIVGVLPVFMACVTFAAALFGPSTARFEGFFPAALTLFAVLNGDVMRETFQMSMRGLGSWGRAIAEIFLYIFVAFFIYIVLNSTTAIMEEAYISSRPEFTYDATVHEYLSSAQEPDRPRERGERLTYRIPRRLRAALKRLSELRMGKSVSIRHVSVARGGNLN